MIFNCISELMLATKRFLHNLHSFLLWEKVKIFDFFKKTMTRINFFRAQLVTINGFAFNHDKSLQIYFFCVKRRAKNDFLKDVESIVDDMHSSK